MKIVTAATAALLWLTAGDAPTATQPMRWQREITVPADGGPVCAVLDAQVLAHAASRSGDDLRVFRQTAAIETEVPFALTESEVEPEDAAEAVVHDVKVHGDEIDFDLTMPRRVYSSVVLRIAAKDFMGRALVTVKDSGRVLGSFGIFDLSGEGLARSTMLALAETTVPELHVSLRLTGPDGRALRATPMMVQGAEVPTSREAQTLYTVVAKTSSVKTTGHWTKSAEMIVPAHVPVERVEIVLDPGFRGEFSRELTVSGTPVLHGSDAVGASEAVSGPIWRVRRQGVAAESLGTEAVLGVTLRDAAKVSVAIRNVMDNRVLTPLPVREVRLEMRQRSVCFDAESDVHYMLRYGDAALSAPIYKQMTGIEQGTVPAVLGPESESAGFHPEAATGRAPQRHAGIVWVVGLSGLVVIWAGAGSLIRRRGGRA